MIYVFLVDTGTMLTFEMNLALENVSVLREVIERAVKVPPEKQVLLISGGEALDPEKRLCHYSAGTDTSPIFLFSKATIEGQEPPSPSVDHGTDTDLKEQVEGALNMPASYNTVVARAQLSQQIHEHTRDVTRSCHQLVHDQHLQQQGWAAVVANLEDIITAFNARYDQFESSFHEYLKHRDTKFEMLQYFDDDLKLLARIPVLPELLGDGAKERHGETEEDSRDKQNVNKTSISLLEWISAKDPKTNVEQVAELCHRGLSQMNAELLGAVSEEVAGVVKQADRPEMKVIKGLSERLCGLEQLMHEASKVVTEQNSFAQALLQNQQRAGRVNDPSIFPDLCTSHRKNLMHMLRNFQKVQDIKRRCIKAKEELSENLHQRLKWIMFIEHKLYELDTRLQMNQELLRRVGNLLQVVEQIHRAPSLYAAAVTEVVRRHAFSSHFLAWANKLSGESGEVWRKEVEVRREFLQAFSAHFLSALFPGMDDLPPDFATHPPPPFDTALPKLTEDNIVRLRSLVPELASLQVKSHESLPPLLRVSLPPKTSRTSEGATTPTTVPPCIPREETETDAEGFEKVDRTGLIDSASVMEVGSERRETESTRAKTKHRFSELSDSKHIKLEAKETQKSPEFVTAEFYIEDPIPAAFSGVAESGVEKKEKNGKRDDEDGVALQNCLRGAKGQISTLKNQLATLRTRVEEEGQASLKMAECLSSQLLPFLTKINNHHEREVSAVRAEYERSLNELHEKMELQNHQLLDAQREVEMYQDQLRRQQETLQLTASEFEEARRLLDEDKHEEVKRLQLEHQVELVAMKQRFDEHDSLRQTQLAALMEKVEGLEEALRETERAKEELEESFRSKLEGGISEEKQKIVQILESSFSEREKKALKQLEEGLLEKHQQEVERILQESRASSTREIEAIRCEVALEREREREEEVEREERRRREERMEWEREKEREIRERERELEERVRGEREEREEVLRQQYKLELDSLRSRFKIMTTASMEKSPSQTSLEKVERGDLIDSDTHEAILMKMREEMKRERETAIEEERREWERRREVEEGRRREEEARREEELRQEERRKIEAEKQTVFNEAIRSVTQDKERVMEDLRLRVELLTDELDKMRRMSGKAGEANTVIASLSTENDALKARCETLQREIIRLETEVLRVKRLSFTTERPPAELTSSFCDSASNDLAKLQQENQELREKLSRSATTLVERGKINVTSCQPGEPILLIWDDSHAHYRVLLEGNPHLHFLHTDSYTTLGLSKESPQRMYSTAEVISKEFCQAKKDENRFHVPKGTKFYRVMAKPWEDEATFRRMGESTSSSNNKMEASALTPPQEQ